MNSFHFKKLANFVDFGKIINTADITQYTLKMNDFSKIYIT